VGSSIGLDRLLAALEELKSPIVGTARSSDVVILNTDAALFPDYDRIARSLRSQGLKVDVYLGQKKLAAQYKWAETNAIPFAILCTAEELEGQTLTLKNLTSRETIASLTINEAALHIKKELF
jgi:histidyl-tRNA synthetase